MNTEATTSTYFVLLSWGQTALYLVQLHDQQNLLSVHYQHLVPIIVKPSKRSYQNDFCKIIEIHYDFDKFTIMANMHTII
jgi:hypothetical protein